MDGYQHCLFVVIRRASVRLCSSLLAIKVMENFEEEMLI